MEHVFVPGPACACMRVHACEPAETCAHEQPLNDHFTLVPQRQEDSKS